MLIINQLSEHDEKILQKDLHKGGSSILPWEHLLNLKETPSSCAIVV